MRGSPLIHFLFGAIVFALFAIPLARLTSSRSEAVPQDHQEAKVAQPADTRHICIRIRFAHQLKSLSLMHGDQELIPAPSARRPHIVDISQRKSPVEICVTLPVPTGGLELALAASWPEGTPDTAITIELEPDELDTRQETRWSTDSSLNAILSFKW